MNEPDENLARLFADDEQAYASSEGFVAAVHRRVARRRALANALKVLGLASLAAAVLALGTIAPEVALYPAQEIGRLLSSPLGAVACLLGSTAVAWWTRYGDA